MDHNLWNLKTAIFHLERRAEQLTQEVSQATYHLRDAKAKQLEGALSQLSIPFELPACYLNPVAYLANATEYTRRDRLNKLIHQTNQLRNKLPALLRQLE